MFTHALGLKAAVNAFETPAISALFAHIGPALDDLDHPFLVRTSFWVAGDLAKKCEVVKGQAIADFVESEAELVVSTGDELIENALRDILAVTQGQEFFQCEETEVSPYWITTYTSFIAVKGGLRLQFETAYEN